ncbi:hypothetical protein Taro_027285 [Colocasia esculenta]|uniref:HRDC domain-containing protein n=1 Tax=Colocasia esculenta TaxID=4460 RepID=A0A843VHP1_COLES|nr:hypothetical protein [Colocasia esculenta]
MEADASPQQEHKAEKLLALAKGPLAASAARLAAHSRALPSGRDFHFYHNFDQFRSPAREIAARSQSLLSGIGSSALLRGSGRQQPGTEQPALPEDLDDAHDCLVNLNDEILERFGVSMDEFRRLREEEEGGAAGGDRAAGMEAGGFQMVYGKKGKKKKDGASDVYGVEGAVDASGGSALKVASRDKKTSGPRSQVPFHIPTIPRPQDQFMILVNNSNHPFEHVWLERSEDGSRFVHPLEKLSVLDFLDGNIGDDEPVKPPLVENTPFTLVEGVKELKELAAKLRKVDEFAVDLEHNHYRSFQGLTCLMQISTRTEDFIVDTLKLRVHVGPHLREVFKDPFKKKVMHGSDRDILWLQRDFGIYVCNLFDTGQASRILQLERNSLEFLLHNFCDVTANKEYQHADWRLRPLPDDMLKYAREDTHYLLYIYDVMKRMLLSESSKTELGDSLLGEVCPCVIYIFFLSLGEILYMRKIISLCFFSSVVKTSEVICEFDSHSLGLLVYKRSYDVCMLLYEKELLTETSYLRIYGLNEADFNPQQLAVVAGLCEWRDNVARLEDESTGYVLPNRTLLEIARQMPLTSGMLKRLVKSKHPYIERHLGSVVAIIRSSIGNAAAFETISEQLKKGHLKAAAGGGVEDDSESPPVIEEHASAETATMDGVGSLERTAELSTSMVMNDGLKTDSSSVIGSCEPSDSVVTSTVEKQDHDLVLPLRAKAVNVASVQTLKKPTSAFGALFGNSSSKRKLDPDSKGRNAEQGKTEIKLEQIKSSVTLPFHSFSGGVGQATLGPGPTLMSAKPQQPEPPTHQENEPRLAAAAELDGIIPLANESDDSQSPGDSPSNNDGLKHREWFPQIPRDGSAERSVVEMSMPEEPMSLSELSSSFQKCFQSTNQSQSAKEAGKEGTSSPLQPYDYAAAGKEVKFGDGQDRNSVAEDDNPIRGRRRRGSAVRHGGVADEEKLNDFQAPRRCQAFPASGNRSATFR